MKESEIIINQDGTIVRKFVNGYVFEGFADGKYEPLSGSITTPDGVIYDIPNFKGEDVYNIFESIKQGKLVKYKRKDNDYETV